MIKLLLGVNSGNMKRSDVAPVVLAVAGFAAIAVGIHQGLVHVAPGYEGTIMTGWGGELNHEEWLLAWMGAIGIAGAAVSLRWRRLSMIPVVMGGIVLFYALRAVVYQFQNMKLYTKTTIYSGDTVVFILGAEPFLLIIGGLLLVAAGITGLRRHTNRENSKITPASASA
jgi:hypothetical protein